MVRQRRAFNNLPDYHKTKQNDREYYVLDDPQFEPEDADFLIGYVGDTSDLTEEDLSRTPPIIESTAERQKYQLTIGTVFINPDTQERETAAFYTDLTGQISANGGLVDDPNRVFGTNFYAWTPPIDYDKHINFGRYFWLSPGAADVAGEYIVKEPQGSKSTIYEYSASSGLIEKKDVRVVSSLPATGNFVGEYVEDASSTARSIFRWNGTAWVLNEFVPVADIPTNTTTLDDGDTFYVGRTGPDFNRPLVWRYSHEARRWIALQVIVSFEQPELTRKGMIWEDLTEFRARKLKLFNGSGWVDLPYTSSNGPTGVGTDGEYIYDTRDYNALNSNDLVWSRENWWRHLEDLSPTDRAFVKNEDQAIRPIIEFYAGIDFYPGEFADFDGDGSGIRDRNDGPLFKKYVYNLSTNEIELTEERTTIYQFKVGTLEDDLVLGFPLSFNDSGEFLFELTLEADSSLFEGYKYYVDTITGFAHSVWHKADFPLTQEQDSDGLFEVPRSITSNADHQILTETSRSKHLLHMSGVIGEQIDFTGDPFGPNNYRWSGKSPTRGSTIIDSEQTLLRAMALLQNNTTGGMPEVIRRLSREYNKALFRFVNRMNQKWDALDLSDAGGTLLVTPEEAVDSILTELFTGRNEQFPYFYADMGTYQETRVTSGAIEIIDTTRKPIFIPPSPPRVGPSPCYKPEAFTDPGGRNVLRGHEGVIITSFGDDRDLIWLNLQNRFFEEVPQFYKEESETFSARFSKANFWLDDYFGDLAPTTTTDPVDDVVVDYNAIVSPSTNQRVFSTSQAEFASYDGFTWLTRRALTDDIFLNNSDGQYYIYNGLGTFEIDDWNRDFDWDYSDGEFRSVLRREFERFILFRTDDFSANTDFDVNNPFTWNYSSAGMEANYRGIYRRVYNTIRPHSHPWEVVGYRIEPTWWRTQYVPTSTAPDGTPRYSNSSGMWSDLQSGIINPITGETRQDLEMKGPIPVDANGELLDPIAAGTVDIGKLDSERIDDVWTYGDGFPTEQEWIESPFYSYSFALAGYLMKNGIWTDTTWSEVYIAIGEDTTIPLGTGPHIIHRDTLTRPAIEDLPIHLEIAEDGSTIQRLGVNAWVSEYVQIIGASPTNDFSRVLKNTEPALAWRTSGFIRENRTDIFLLSSEEIPFDDIHTLLHVSQPVDEQFCSGVQILRENPVGYRVFGYDSLRPFFRVELPALPVAGGQVENRETIVAETNQHVFETEELSLPFNVFDNDTAKLSVVIDGFRVRPQHIKVTGKNTFEIEDVVRIQGGEEVTATVVTTQSNPSTRIRTLKVDGISFSYAARGNGQIVDIEYGRFFQTPQEVINFMIGYGRVLESEGWVFDDIEPTTGQQRDWLFGAKSFATWIVDNESIGRATQDRTTDLTNLEVFEFSPIARKARLDIPFGQNLNVESLQNGAYGILNVNSEPIPADNTFSARVREKLEVEVNEDVQDEQQMFGLRVNITEIQHVVFLSNITRFGDLIYDPVIALFHKTLRVDSYRTNDWQGRLEAPGYIVNNGELIPNFEKNAFDFTRFYDRIRPLDDSTKRDQARNLYGWTPTPQDEYMDAINAADRSRFDYYRGMINAKGTVRPIIAYARGTRLGRDNVFIYEDWAWKLAQFGDTRREIVRLNLDKNDLLDEATVICFGCDNEIFNKTLEIQDYNRTNTVLGTEFEPTFVPGESFGIEVAGKSVTVTLDTGGNLFDTANEINDLLADDNIVEVEAFIANRKLAFRNTLNYTVTEYTLTSGLLNDLLLTAGVEPETYNVDNSRWILPPETGQDGISNLTFPMVPATGLPDISNFDFYAKTYDTDPITTLNKHFHFDPEIGKFDPQAVTEVDLQEVLDPARYNRGPGNLFSNNLVWGEDQVGMLWWDKTRAKYVDYRRPFDGSDLVNFSTPDYETSAKIWGRLEFFRAVITRDGEVATVSTRDIFDIGTPVEHGLKTGDTISIRDADPDDWNVTDVPITLGAIEVKGDIPFMTDQAIGDVDIGTTVTVTGRTEYGDIISIEGDQVFDVNNFVEGTEGDPFFRVGDAFRVRMPATGITYDFQTAIGGTAAQFRDEINQGFNTASIFELEAFADFVQFLNGQALGFTNRLNNEGVPFELTHIESFFSGSNNSPGFVVGDEFTITTPTDGITIFIQGTYGLSAADVAQEINLDWLTPASMTEVLADSVGDALAFKTFDHTTTYVLSSGLQGQDLLAKAGIDPGTYGSVLTKAGITAGRYDSATIPGQDEDLTLAIVAVTTGIPGIFEVLGDVTETFVPGFTFEVFGSTGNDAVYTVDTTGSTFSTPNTIINVVENIIDPTVDGDIHTNKAVAFRLYTEIDILATTGITPRALSADPEIITLGVPQTTPTTVAGDVPFLPQFKFRAGARLQLNVNSVDVDFELNIDSDIDDLVIALNDAFTTAGVAGDVVASKNGSNQLQFDFSTTPYTFTRVGGIDFVNSNSSSLSAVVNAVNTALQDSGAVVVEAFNSEDKFGFRNAIGYEGRSFAIFDPPTMFDPTDPLPFQNTAPVPPSLLALVDLDDGVLRMIPELHSFGMNTLSGEVLSPQYVTPYSGSVDEIVSDINTYLPNNGITEVEAFNSGNRIAFRNTPGNEGKGFNLESGTIVNDLLTNFTIDPKGVFYTIRPADFATLGTFELIPSNTGFDVTTGSGKLQFNSEGGNLDFIIREINEQLPIARVIGTVNGPTFVPGADFTISVFGNGTKILNFISAGGGVGSLVSEINSAFSSLAPLPITEVQAINDGGHLRFENVSGNSNIEFLLEPGTVVDILSTSGIEPRQYGRIVEVEATRQGNVLILQNTSGRQNERFVLEPPTNPSSTTDLLLLAGFYNVPSVLEYGQYEASSGFNIRTDTNAIVFRTENGGTLDSIVAEINEEFNALRIVEVEAVNEDGFLKLQNTEDYPGSQFVLSTTTPDLLAAVGMLPGDIDRSSIQGKNTIVSVNQGFSQFDIEGDLVQELTSVPNKDFRVTDSTGNDGAYTVNTAVYNVGPNTTTITSNETISDPTTDGFITIGKGYTYITDLTKFVFEIDSEPTSPAEGDPRVLTGAIDLYEWVRSPVPPSQWVDYIETLTAPDHPTGVPLNVDDPSYVELTSISNGKTVSTYYFWVQGNTGANIRKDLPTNIVENKLISPTTERVAWFAPMDTTNMLIYQGTLRVEDDYAIEILTDQRDLETHVEWAVVSENDQFNNVPDAIVDKVLDSLSGINDQGAVVPSPLLNEAEKYGSCFFPIQTIYQNREVALDVYIQALNSILALTDLSRFDPLISIFNLDDEQTDANPSGFWKRSKYIEEEYRDKEIFDVVVTEDERNRRGTEGRYIDGDLVEVLQSGNTDPFLRGPFIIKSANSTTNEFTVEGDVTYNFRPLETIEAFEAGLNNDVYRVAASGSTFDGTDTIIPVIDVAIEVTTGAVGRIKFPVATTYVFQGGAFIEVGVNNHSIEINNNVDDNTTKFRALYERTYAVLERTEQNSLIFSMLHEMMRQHLNCDWFIKTSYISTQIFDKISKSPFVRASEPQAILDNIIDVKPFRTKFRRQAETYTVEEIEDVPVEILEFPDIRITMLVDRLACDNTEDGGWDAYPWDTENPPGDKWDQPLWALDDLGRADWFEIGEIQGGTSFLIFEFEPPYSPQLFPQRAVLFNNGVETDLLALGLNVTFETTSTLVRVILSQPLAGNFRLSIQQAQGLVEGLELTLPQTLLDAGYTPTPSTYEHHLPRVIRQGAVDRSNPTEGMSGCESDDCPGGNAEERVVTDVVPSVNICVRNTWSEALGAWDAAPWDTTPWDSPPQDVGDRIFIIAVGGQEEIPSGNVILPTSELFIDGSSGFQPPYILGSDESWNRVLVEVSMDGGASFDPVTEGVEYEVVEPFNNILKFGAPVDEIFIADGVSTIYGPIVSPTGIGNVRVNNVLLTDTIDYNIVTIGPDTFIDFAPIQPPPFTVQEKFTHTGASFEGNNFTFGYDINFPRNSLTKDNVLVFRNGLLEDSANYNVATVDYDVELTIGPPVPTDTITITALGNNFGDNQSLVTDVFHNGTGGTTTFSVGNNARIETTFVWVNGSYQHHGAPNDYTFIGAGTPTAQIVFNIPPPPGANNIEVRIFNSPLGSMLPYVDMAHVVTTATGGPPGTVDAIPGLFDLESVNQVMVFLNGELKDSYTATGTPEYTIQDALPGPDEIVWNIPTNPGDLISVRVIRFVVSSEVIIQNVAPQAGDEIKVKANSYLTPTEQVRIRYNGWPVGPYGPFEISDFPNPGLYTFSGDNSTDTFLVGNNVLLENMTVFVDGEFQQPGPPPDDDYQLLSPGTLSASLLFTIPPPTGVDNIVVQVDIPGVFFFQGDGINDTFTVGNDARFSNTTVKVEGQLVQPENYRVVDEGTSTASVVFNVESIPPASTVDNVEIRVVDFYTIEDGILTLPQDIPDPGQSVTVEYKEPRKGKIQHSILVRMQIIAEEMLDDHLSYDDPNGFEDVRFDGIIYVNTTDNTYYQWDEGTSSWNVFAVAAPGDMVYVRRTMEIWEFDGVSFNKVFDVGDTYTTPPVLQYPPFGKGIRTATYTLGQAPNAEFDFPEPWQVIQHPGDCG